MSLIFGLCQRLRIGDDYLSQVSYAIRRKCEGRGASRLRKHVEGQHIRTFIYAPVVSIESSHCVGIGENQAHLARGRHSFNSEDLSNYLSNPALVH
jgi:hypothetical protein